MIMRKALLVFLTSLVLLAFTFTGCSQTQTNNAGSAPTTITPSTTSAATTTASGKPVNLRIMWWGNQTRHDITQKVLQMYSAKFPYVTFEPEFLSYADYYQKISTQAAANSMPDIFQCYVGIMDTNMLIQKNLVEPLDQYVNDNTIDLSSFSESVILQGKMNDKLYGISLGSNAYACVIDPAMFEKAGVKVPSAGYTWDDLQTLALQIHNKLGTFGMSTIGSDIALAYYARQNGKQLFSTDGKSVGVDEKTIADYFRMEMDWQKKGIIATPDIDAQIKAVEDSLLVKQQSAIEFTLSNQLIAYSTAAKRPLELMILPGPNTSNGMFIRTSQHFAIAASSANKVEAAKFISYFVNDIDANKILNAERGIPDSSKVRDALKSSVTPDMKKIFDYMDLVAANCSPKDPPEPTNSAQVYQLLVDTEAQVRYEKVTPEQAAKNFIEQANKILAQ